MIYDLFDFLHIVQFTEMLWMKRETATSARMSLSRMPWRASLSLTCSRSNGIKLIIYFKHIVNIVYFNFQLHKLNLSFHQWLLFKLRPRSIKPIFWEEKSFWVWEREAVCNPMRIGLVLLHLPDNIFCFTFLPPQNHLRLYQQPQLLNIPSANIFKYFQNNNVCKSAPSPF